MSKTARPTVPASYTTSKGDLRKLYNAWQMGKMTKADCERAIGCTSGRSKTITRLWSNVLGCETTGIK